MAKGPVRPSISPFESLRTNRSQQRAGKGEPPPTVVPAQAGTQETQARESLLLMKGRP